MNKSVPDKSGTPQGVGGHTRKWATYVDGFNFYHAVRDRLPDSQLHLGWCDFSLLSQRIIGSRGELTCIKYFTAPVGDLAKPDGERDRQALWLRALRTIPKLEVVEGFFIGDRSFHNVERRRKRQEKATDVNIALALVLDAARQVYDSAILITGDYDQIPAVRTVIHEFSWQVCRNMDSARPGRATVG